MHQGVCALLICGAHKQMHRMLSTQPQAALLCAGHWCWSGLYFQDKSSLRRYDSKQSILDLVLHVSEPAMIYV